MNSLLVVVAAAILSFQFVNCVLGPDPALEYQKIADAVVVGLQDAGTDVTLIQKAVNSTTAEAAKKITAFVQETVGPVEEPAKQSIRDLAATIRATVKPETCTKNYTQNIDFYERYHVNIVPVCGANRFTNLLQQNVINLQAYVAAKLSDIKDTLSTAQDGGQDFLPKLVIAGAGNLAKTINSSVVIGWVQEALAYQTCISANHNGAVTEQAFFVKQIQSCGTVGPFPN